MTEVVRLQEHSRQAKVGPCEIQAYRAMHATLGVCKRLGQIGIVTGPSGCGKTTAARAFEQDDADTTYVRMTTTANTAQPFLVRLCAAMRVYVSPNLGKSDLSDEIIASLRLHGEHLLIIDEMNHATPEIVHLIRDIWDATRIGIALVGTPETVLLWAESSRRKAGHGDPFAAFRGRIGQQATLNRPVREDVDALCKHLALTGKPERDLISKRLQQRDGLHALDQLFANARQLAGKGNSITAQNLLEADSLMGALNINGGIQ